MSREDEAWQLYRDRGVVIPEFSGEIAARRKVLLDWREIGCPLS